MLSTTQRETFQKIKEGGGLTAKQKGDFYYRMSKILKDELEGLNDLVFLLNELPDSYMKNKIDFKKVAVDAMGLTEKLIDMLDPPAIREDNHQAKQRFRVDLASALPGFPSTIAIYKAFYSPSKEEIDFSHRLLCHTQRLKEILTGGQLPKLYSVREFDMILSDLRKKRDFRIEEQGLVKTPSKELIDKIQNDGDFIPSSDVDRAKPILSRKMNENADLVTETTHIEKEEPK
jgi:hypothetical protein